MKLLVLGGHGMAGHVITHYFMQKSNFQVFYTSRNKADKDSIYLDVTNSTRLEEIIDIIKPDFIINCIGVLIEYAENNPEMAHQINSILPYQIAKLADRYQSKLIHLSTDCVFSGKKGNYTEDDEADGTTIYAQSKKLGEIKQDNHLTIRTSIIGPELKEDGQGLFLWFMKQQGQIKGFEKVLWNGVTTLELAKAIDVMIEKEITGLIHVGAKQKVSKYTLLKMIQDIFDKQDVKIIADDQNKLDRTVKSNRSDFSYEVPCYENMLLDMKEWMEQNHLLYNRQ
ncbi:dTDP-4-dehydrorhamnose reductase family protein [Gracilibacillus salinarum]|uniref:dTDP-4-dehydrorhamnose reductase n=1 Tax=Gracilibacillus salinarum TaxID=2932255 RepID=A0ABY4GKZ8_9BACI|nr:SDR family oxidoreductase [Gracilibacillus salinarum]UOQ84886.1 SDR family oxidoreductase [Gracilibacillus salinarum]